MKVAGRLTDEEMIAFGIANRRVVPPALLAADLPAMRPGNRRNRSGDRSSAQLETDRQIGRNLRELRKAAAWSQIKLGEKLGVSGALICLYELGQKQLYPDELNLLSEVFEVPVDRFFEPLQSDAVVKAFPFKDRCFWPDEMQLKAYLDRLSPQMRQHLLGVMECAADKAGPQTDRKRKGPTAKTE